MNCMRCNVPMELELAPSSVAGKYRRKQECPKCHVRTFAFIETAEKNVNVPLRCNRCYQSTGTVDVTGVCPRCIAEGKKTYTLPPNKEGAKLIGKNLKCERCDGVAEILYVVPMSDQLMCGLCKVELGETADLMHRYKSALAY